MAEPHICEGAAIAFNDALDQNLVDRRCRAHRRHTLQRTGEQIGIRDCAPTSPQQHSKRWLARAIPNITLDGQEETQALAGRQFARHDSVGIVDEILGGSEDAHDSSVCIAEDNRDSASIGVERRSRERWFAGDPLLTLQNRNLPAGFWSPEPHRAILRRRRHHIRAVRTECGTVHAADMTSLWHPRSLDHLNPMLLRRAYRQG
jgi:hypothetical protein